MLRFVDRHFQLTNSYICFMNLHIAWGTEPEVAMTDKLSAITKGWQDVSALVLGQLLCDISHSWSRVSREHMDSVTLRHKWYAMNISVAAGSRITLEYHLENIFLISSNIDPVLWWIKYTYFRELIAHIIHQYGYDEPKWSFLIYSISQETLQNGAKIDFILSVITLPLNSLFFHTTERDLWRRLCCCNISVLPHIVQFSVKWNCIKMM